MLFAGVLALIMRAQLAVPDNDLVSANTFNQLFTLHGSMMMFLFAVPMFEAVSIILLPQLLGARDLPFPRLSAFGYWSFLIGGVFVAGSIFFDAAPDGGWFMYPPLTTRTDLSGLGADIWMLGLSLHRGVVGRRRGRADRRRPQVPPARHAAQPDAALRLVHPGRRGDDPVRLPAADRGRRAVRDGARSSTGRSSTRSAAAIRCCGSTCSGSSATRRSTSSSCRRSRSSRC